MKELLHINDKDTLYASDEFSKLSAIEYMTVFKLNSDNKKAILTLETSRKSPLHFHLDAVNCRKLVEQLGMVLIHLEDQRLANQGPDNTSSRETTV